MCPTGFRFVFYQKKNEKQNTIFYFSAEHHFNEYKSNLVKLNLIVHILLKITNRTKNLFSERTLTLVLAKTHLSNVEENNNELLLFSLVYVNIIVQLRRSRCHTC